MKKNASPFPEASRFEKLLLIDKGLISFLMLVALALLFIAPFVTSNTKYVYFFGSGLGALLTAVFLHSLSTRARWQFQHGGISWKLLFLIGWVLSGLMALTLQVVIPLFHDVLLPLGDDLTWPTRLVLVCLSWMLLVPLGVGLVWMHWFDPVARLKAATIASWIGVTVLTMAFASIYLPILKIG